MTFVANITDNLSGLNSVQIQCSSQSGEQYFNGWVNTNQSDGLDNYEGKGYLPQYAQSGLWNCDNIYLRDKAGNRTSFYEADLVAIGATSAFTVASSEEDSLAPQLMILEVVPGVVSTIGSPGAVTFYLDIEDAPSGFNSGHLWLVSPSRAQQHAVHFNWDNLVDGSLQTYELAKELPQYSEYGEWKIHSVYLTDKTTNRINYVHQDLIDLGLPSTLLVEGAGTGGPDDTVIGPDGGIIESPDGILTVGFPAGAVDEEVTISITEVGRFEPVDIRIGPNPGQGNAIAEYKFQPEGLEFDPAVIVTMTVDVTELNQNQRNRLNMYLYTDTDDDGIEDVFVPVPAEDLLSVEVIENGDGTVFMVFTMQVWHFSTYAVIMSLDEITDAEPPVVTVVIPVDDATVQGHVTFSLSAIDESAVASASFTIRKFDGEDGEIIGLEEVVAAFNAGTGHWELGLDTTGLQDGLYFVFGTASDEYGNEGLAAEVSFSVRNLASSEMLPASKVNRAGRTMPVKFALRLIETADPLMPFVYSESLKVLIYDSSDMGIILQQSEYGASSRDYRIDPIGEKYITNFKTMKQPADYIVEIRRVADDYLYGSFSFVTSRK